MAGINKPQDSVPVHDEVAAELGGVVTVRVVSLFSRQPGFEVIPARVQVAGAPVGTFQAVGIVNRAVTVEQNSEGRAGLLHPLLDGGKRSKGNNKDADVELFEFVLTGAQLCDMLAAGYSAKVTEKDEQGVSTFEDFAEGDLFAFDGLQGEVGGGGLLFHKDEG